MCDTVVALGNVTADGAAIFGKNSDREPNEAHHLIRVPRMQHAPGSRVKCTYVEIAQVAETYEVLLAKPFWIWGAEMGSNEHGVTIGNEAVFTRVPYEKRPGLIGMDFLRLALERAATAREALDVITALLAEHGQGGNCGFTHAFYYHNSFIIADPTDAWVLETVDRQWAAEQVKDIRTISNGLTIREKWDAASDDLIRFAQDRRLYNGQGTFDFAKVYSDFLYTKFGDCESRQCRTTDTLTALRGGITVQSVMRALRDHGEGDSYTPARGVVGLEVCMHAGVGPIRKDQTTGSIVSHLAPDVQTHYVTGTSAPCTSVFKPVWLGADLPGTGPVPTGTYDEHSLFWRHEVLHRATLRNYPALINLYAKERDALEAWMIEGAEKYRAAAPGERADYAAQCFSEANLAEARWTESVLAANVPTRQGALYKMAWDKFNRAAQMPAGAKGVLLPQETETRS